MKTPRADVVVIGAGTAGISAARIFQQNGLEVVVIDKSRGLGGRAATRRFECGPVDHGAQFFTAKSREFIEHTNHWLRRGLCREWTRGFPIWEKGTLHAPAGGGHPRFCCPGGMTAPAKLDAQDLTIWKDEPVSAVTVENGALLTTTTNRSISSAAVICTAPAPQALKILESLTVDEDRNTLSETAYDPCFCAIYDLPGCQPAWPAIEVHGSPISWIADDGSRRQPIRSGPYVVHASPEFSLEHLEQHPMEVAQLLTGPLAEILGTDLPDAKILHAHRWRYARPRPAAKLNSFYPLVGNPDVCFAGDACGTGNIESAWLSGRAAAECLLARISQPRVPGK